VYHLIGKAEVTMQLELNEQEQEELIRLVTAAHGDTSSEIHHAMDHETREMFRQRRAMLDNLLKRLGAKSQPVS
jgi:hypothetical protein